MVSIDPNSPPQRPAQVASEKPASAAPNQAMLQAWGRQFITTIVAQIAMALGNVDVLGVKPLAFLTSWGQNLENTANNAQSTATSAQSTANGVAAMLDGIAPGSGTVVSYITSALASIPGVSNAITWVDAGLALFGIPGLDQSGVSSAGGNLMSLLGNPNLGAGSAFDPITAGEDMLQSVLTPAGALSGWTQLPAHLLGYFSPGGLGNQGNSIGGLLNLLSPAVAGFDSPSALVGSGQWFHSTTVGRTVNSNVVGSIYTIAQNVLRDIKGVPIFTAPGQLSQLGGFFNWSGLIATAGQPAIQLAANAYDKAGNLLNGSDPARIVNSITNPSATSAAYAGDAGQQPPVPAAGSDGWVFLSGPFTAPANTAYVRLTPVITAAAGGGVPVYFDDAAHGIGGLIDAAHLGNIANGPVWPSTNVAGFQGLEDMLVTLTHTFDGLGSAFNQGSDLTGVTPPQLFGLAQDMATSASLALQHAVDAINILGIRNNRPAAAGLDPTSVPSFHLLSGDGPVASNMTAVPAGTAIMATALRVEQDIMPGVIEFIGFSNGGSGIIANLYKITNPTTADKTLLWASPDLGTLVPTGTTPGYVRALIPNAVQSQLKAGDTLAVGIANTGAGTLSVHTKARGTPNHPTVMPKNFGGTRTLASTGGTSPTTLADSAITYSGTVPHVNLAVLSVPKAVIPPVKYKYSSAAQVPVPIPAEFQVDGTLIFLTGVGAGGSGMSEWNAGVMAGGTGGGWALGEFVYGADPNGTGLPIIPHGTTQLIGVIGAGGARCTGFWQNGNPGGRTQVWLGAVTTGTLLLDAAGGAGGSNSVGLSPGTGYGPTPSSQVVDTTETMFAGGNVGINQNGAAPGGGGGGATWGEMGGPGADGELWAKIRQP